MSSGVPSEPPVVAVGAEVDAIAEEAFCALLGEAASRGFEVREAGPHRVRIVLYVDASCEGAVAEAVGALRRAATDLAQCWPEHGDVTVGTPEPVRMGWRERWREWFRPSRISSSIVVGPPWLHWMPRPAVQFVEIEPGLAFGTGLHATTRLAMRLCEDVAPRARVCDVGTGSGVIAIACALLGARRVVALDTDPLAVEAARANVARNAVGDLVWVSAGSVDQVSGEAFDVVVANIVTPVLEDLCERLIQLVALRGTLVLCGILESEAERVALRYTAAGSLELAARLGEDGWVGLRFRSTQR